MRLSESKVILGDEPEPGTVKIGDNRSDQDHRNTRSGSKERKRNLRPTAGTWNGE